MLENEHLVLDWDDELTVTLIDNYSDEIIQQFENSAKGSSPVVAQHQVEKVLNLHDQEINLGYEKVEFQDAFAVNLKEIKERKSNVVRMKSRTKKMHISYTNEINEEVPPANPRF